MDKGSIRSLEYSRLLQALAERAATQGGSERARSLMPSPDTGYVARRLEEAGELAELVDRKLNTLPPWQDDIKGPLEVLEAKAGRLDADALLRIRGFLSFAAKAASFSRSLPEEFPALRRAYNRFEPADHLKDAISAAISDDAVVKDTASPELKRIRGNLARARSRLNNLLDDFLDREDIGLPQHQRHVTVREGRLVIPVRADARAKVGGLVHDYSRSRATVFVEPLDAVELNNELSFLRAEEREEVERILTELTEEARQELERLKAGHDALVHLDLIWARHRLAADLGGTIPTLVEPGEGLLLKGALNPLLGLEGAAVPVDIDIPRDARTVVISGPNTGGKTATIKTMGLICAMAQVGVPVPAKQGAKVPVFDFIFAEVGDEQNLASHLSTFSAHLERLGKFLNEAGAGSLVLIDELGTGTDPEEGAALGMAVLDRFAEAGCLAVVTTHYHALKGYGAIREGVLNVAVGFDEETQSPTYQLLYGQPGVSLGLDTAKRLGFPEAVIEKAGGYLGTREQRTAALLRELTEAKESMSRASFELQQEREAVAKELDEAARERRELEEEKAAFFKRERQRLLGLAGEVENSLKDALKKLKERGPLERGRARDAVKKAREALAESFPAESFEPFTGEVDLGDVVGIAGSSSVGEVTHVSRDGSEVELRMGGVRLKVPRERLRATTQQKPGAKRPRAEAPVSAPDADAVSHRVYLLGMRVEEAVGELDRFLDRALLAGLSTVEVVHGHGTGALRHAVAKFLEEHPGVKRFYHPGQNQGGKGVTMAELE